MTVLLIMAPMHERSKRWATSWPTLKHPDAGMTGAFKVNGPTCTDRSGVVAATFGRLPSIAAPPPGRLIEDYLLDGQCRAPHARQGIGDLPRGVFGAWPDRHRATVADAEAARHVGFDEDVARKAVGAAYIPGRAGTPPRPAHTPRAPAPAGGPAGQNLNRAQRGRVVVGQPVDGHAEGFKILNPPQPLPAGSGDERPRPYAALGALLCNAHHGGNPGSPGNQQHAAPVLRERNG